MNGRLNDRHALLTGAGGGIGLAVTRAYLAEGARCTVVDIDEQPSAELLQLLARQKVLVKAGDLYFHAAALERLKAEIRALKHDPTAVLDVGTFAPRSASRTVSL